MQRQTERPEHIYRNQWKTFCSQCHSKLKTSFHIFFNTCCGSLQNHRLCNFYCLYLFIFLLYLELYWSVCIVPIVGSTLITVGEYQRRLGGAEREFLQTSAATFLTPLRNFLEGDWRTISVSLTYLHYLRLWVENIISQVKRGLLIITDTSALNCCAVFY